jgi:hypothetical protein
MVVVMPVTMMAVFGAKHRVGLIPESAFDCQTFGTGFTSFFKIDEQSCSS